MKKRNPDQAADHGAWLLIVAMFFVSFLVESRSGHMELLRSGVSEASAFEKEWLYELSSHIAILVAATLIPFWLNRFPLSVSNIWRRVPVYVLGFALFTLIHVTLMVGLRHAAWPFIADGVYEFGLLRWEPWIYEAQKDVFTFIAVMGTFIAARHMALLRQEVQMTRADAKTCGRLSLKSGGRVITLPASDVVYAKSAGNYVELYTDSGRHFVRLTLGELETLLDEAKANPVRLHRSYLTLQPHLREVGGTDIRLSTGKRLPLGRSYRDKVKALT